MSDGVYPINIVIDTPSPRNKSSRRDLVRGGGRGDRGGVSGIAGWRGEWVEGEGGGGRGGELDGGGGFNLICSKKSNTTLGPKFYCPLAPSM
jgi:hypothetical protein